MFYVMREWTYNKGRYKKRYKTPQDIFPNFPLAAKAGPTTFSVNERKFYKNLASSKNIYMVALNV